MQLPHKYLQRVLQRILPLLDSLSVQSTHRTNINVYQLLFVGGEALGTLCTQPKHGRTPFGGNANLEILQEEAHYLPIHSCNLSCLSFPVTFLYLQLRGSV